ncbi:MAG: hypothetical protein K0R50_1242 [Eubacterium sp.]|jgi:hypothetical protein|nr:hypothetical protein [Eubacterium sp.]
MAQVNDLSSLIITELINYSEEVTEKVKQAVDTVSREVNSEIKNKIPFNQHTGKYVKAFRVKTVYENNNGKKSVWHVVNGQHRLTHLLEHGHAKRNGGRVKEYPHIRYGEELAIKRMEELTRGAIER